ncbi:MAG: hypothetical protein LBH09_08165 [Peptococcaceae bacterium]|nr:hypothetical protein [Peptococcaceae bacterium]
MQPPLPDDFDCRFPGPLGGKLKEWLDYKAARTDFYSPIGLRNLLVQIDKRIGSCPPETVADLISECMANNWAGIIWDKIERQGIRPRGKRGLRPAGRCQSAPQSEWDALFPGDNG